MANKKTTKKAPAKKTPAKRDGVRSSFIAKAPVRRLMKGEGAKIVSDGALQLLIKQLESQATKTIKKALSLVKDEKRKRLTADDITWAIK